MTREGNAPAVGYTAVLRENDDGNPDEDSRERHVKKGRHRRFEEARALKQAFDLGAEPGSTIMEAPFDPDLDEFAVKQTPGADWSDLNLVLWLSEAPSVTVKAAIDEAVEDWRDEVETPAAGGILYDFQEETAGESTDGRNFVAWWADMGTLPRSVVAGLATRFSALRDGGLPLVALEVGADLPPG
jgi:hypothetical protein